MSRTSAPPLVNVLETALYVGDMELARDFYQSLPGLPALFTDARLCAYDVGCKIVLLLFQKGSTLETVHMPGGTIPPHDGSGPVHFAFGIAAGDLARWEEHLTSHGVAVEGRTDWPRGGRSLYFRDPDGHLVELVTPGVWTIY